MSQIVRIMSLRSLTSTSEETLQRKTTARPMYRGARRLRCTTWFMKALHLATNICWHW